MRRLSIVTGFLLWYCSLLTRAQPGPCEAGSTEIGFGTISEVNAAMAAELERIQGGLQPQKEYTFNLCSQKVYDAENEPLRPVLSNLFVVCGPDGKSNNLCTFLGGAVQVEIIDSTVLSYPLTDVTLSGITFADFKNMSVAALASSSTNLNLMDVVFTGFAADFVLRQTSMSVDLTECAINGGTAGSVFANDGGQLTVSNLIVSDLDAASLISTSNEGVSFLEDSSITDSAFDSITTTASGAAQSVFRVEVSQMRRIQETFQVDQPLSRLILNTVSIKDNNFTTDTPWRGVVARNGATATAGQLDFSSNSGVESGVLVTSGGSILTLIDSFIGNNQGTGAENVRPSAPAFALSNSTLAIQRTEFIGNKDFSAEILVLIKSSVNLTQSCIQDGSARFVVSIDSSSTFEASLNFIDHFVSQRCPASDPMLRLFKENPDSGCFFGSNVCEGTCEQVSDQTQCLAKGAPTGRPSLAMSSPPTTAPTPLPNTTMPVAQPPSRSPTVPLSIAPTRKAPTPLTPPHPTIRPTSICPGKSKKGKSIKSKKQKHKSSKHKSKKAKGKGKGKGGMSKGGMMGMSCGKGAMSKGVSSKGGSKGKGKGGSGGSPKSSPAKGKGKGGKGGSTKSAPAESPKSARRTTVRAAPEERLTLSDQRESMFWDRRRRIQEHQNQRRDLRGSPLAAGLL